jgi:hypothetical protein
MLAKTILSAREMAGVSKIADKTDTRKMAEAIAIAAAIKSTDMWDTRKTGEMIVLAMKSSAVLRMIVPVVVCDTEEQKSVIVCVVRFAMECRTPVILVGNSLRTNTAVRFGRSQQTTLIAVVACLHSIRVSPIETAVIQEVREATTTVESKFRVSFYRSKPVFLELPEKKEGGNRATILYIW